MTEPVKVMAPMATPRAISNKRGAMDRADAADAEGLRRVERAGGDQHRCEAHQRVEGGDELRHRRHGHALGHHRADAAADGKARDHQRPAGEIGRRLDQDGGEDRDPHTHHAVEVALSRGGGMRQAAKRQDEEDARDQIEERGKVW